MESRPQTARTIDLRTSRTYASSHIMNRMTNGFLRCVAALLIVSATAGVRARDVRAAQRSDATPRVPSRFHVEEATIADLHRAIQQGETTCRAVVESYVERARAYNGACTQLVTRDANPNLPTTGPVRAGVPVSFPTSTMSVASVLPTFEAYSGLPLDL